MSNQWTNATPEYRAKHREATELAQWMKEHSTLVEWLKKHPEAMGEIQTEAFKEGVTA